MKGSLSPWAGLSMASPLRAMGDGRLLSYKLNVEVSDGQGERKTGSDNDAAFPRRVSMPRSTALRLAAGHSGGLGTRQLPPASGGRRREALGGALARGSVKSAFKHSIHSDPEPD